jgi:hypothetical protein
MRLRVAFNSLFVSALLAGPASAAQYSCDSYVSGVTTQRGGVDHPLFHGQRCERYHQCKSVYATLLAAQVAGKRVRLWFDDTLTCSTQPSWAYATGWCYGPELLAF